ncbi:hypothetical protein HK104_004795 [Borealophlyctis nickersoniae]|nr:hypothetical protein HK104_004795 [Borealophlyctis nickersoniae]
MSRQAPRLFNLASRQLVQRRTATTSTAEVKTQAQEAATKAQEAAKNAGSKLVQKLTGFAEPIIYYSRVGFEFARSVATHQKLAVPDVASATQGLTNFYQTFTNGAWKKVTVRQAGQILGEGVKIGGFFLVGEMIGKGSVIGYQIPGTERHEDH